MLVVCWINPTSLTKDLGYIAVSFPFVIFHWWPCRRFVFEMLPKRVWFDGSNLSRGEWTAMHLILLNNSGLRETKTSSQTSSVESTSIRTFHAQCEHTWMFSTNYHGWIHCSHFRVDFQDLLVNELKILVKKQKLVEVTIDEGWFSEAELRDEYSWTQPKS